MHKHQQGSLPQHANKRRKLNQLNINILFTVSTLKLLLLISMLRCLIYIYIYMVNL